MIDLIEAHRDAIIALCRQYGVRRLHLFGSAATGAFDASTSDLDFIATFADTEKPGYAHRYFGFAEALEALFGRPVDLLTEGSIRNPYFRQAIEATRQQAIGQYTAGPDFAAYEREPMVRDAVERRFGIIGEALNRAVALEPEVADRVPELREIVGLRNRVIHGYDAVDDRVIWDTVQNDLPLLQAHIAELIGEESET